MTTLRPASAADRALLVEAMAAAINRMRAPGEQITAADVRTRPELRHYVDAFPRPEEFGVVATAGSDPLAVAWVSLLSADDPGYGYVRDDVPEVCLAVLEDGARGRGLGTTLLTAVLDEARARGFASISLVVERNNPAARLYRRLGFETVRETEHDLIMVRTLTELAI